METAISAKTLRHELASVMERVQKGERFTVLYRSQPVCRIVPVDGPSEDPGDLADEPLYQAGPLGCSVDGLSAADHDKVLYGDQNP